MSRYLLTSDAEHDLDEIKAYLLRQGGRRLALYVLREIREALRFLARTPEAGHRREDLTDAPVKFWAVFSYLVVYDSAKRPIEILNVIHSAGDVSSIVADDD